jgi:site-specific recombinase XerD
LHQGQRLLQNRTRFWRREDKNWYARPGLSTALLGPFLQYSVAEHLASHKHANHQTVISYRDTFRLLLQFLRRKTGKAPAKSAIDDLDAPNLLDFPEHLERERKNQVCSRNVRLTAIRSSFRVVALRSPASLGVVRRVLAILSKKPTKQLVGYVTREEMDAILAAPDQATWIGRRDRALLLAMYNSGARLSEMTALRHDHVRLEAGQSHLQIHGKGRKERTVPLWPETAPILKPWLRKQQGSTGTTDRIFLSVRQTPLSADGVNYILQQAVGAAAKGCANLRTKHVTPHMIRHGTAMALLQGGVHIAVIALYLGHEGIETTHIYLEADLAMKERALASIAPDSTPLLRFRADDMTTPSWPLYNRLKTPSTAMTRII